MEINVYFLLWAGKIVPTMLSCLKKHVGNFFGSKLLALKLYKIKYLFLHLAEILDEFEFNFYKD